jgi:hypothetical protein
MARQEKIECISMEAGADLSTHQFKFVVEASDGQIDPVGANGGDADGVLQNQPDAAGRAAQVAVAGIAKVKAAAAITQGSKVSSNGSGLAQTAASGHHVLGRAMNSVGAANELVEVLLDSSHHLLA